MRGEYEEDEEVTDEDADDYIIAKLSLEEQKKYEEACGGNSAEQARDETKKKLMNQSESLEKSLNEEWMNEEWLGKSWRIDIACMSGMDPFGADEK